MTVVLEALVPDWTAYDCGAARQRANSRSKAPLDRFHSQHAGAHERVLARIPLDAGGERTRQPRLESRVAEPLNAVHALERLAEDVLEATATGAARAHVAEDRPEEVREISRVTVFDVEAGTPAWLRAARPAEPKTRGIHRTAAAMAGWPSSEEKA